MIFSFLLVLITIYLLLVFKRYKRYGYQTTKDYLYDLEKNKITNLKITNDKLLLPKIIDNYDTLFLRVSLSFNPLSIFFKPYIKIDDIKHYFEYGAKGIRYINISHNKTDTLKLDTNYLSLFDDVVLYGYNNHIANDENILILAPHADDAEIASFGLYKKAHNVTIVTTTMGENGACNYCDIYNHDKNKQMIKKAELRTFDALSVPLLGGVTPSNTLTLGYFGSSLKWMSKNRDIKFKISKDNKLDINDFRKINHTDIKLTKNIKPTYSCFLEDLKNILKHINPSIIITPHPTIDNHSDHQQTTYAVIEVLKELNLNTKFLLYTNHLKTSETYPIGPMNSIITLPPNFEPFYFDSIYSFELDKDLQIDKFFALEAMHDLRDSLIFISTKKAYKQLSKMIRRKLTGKEKTYYKRGVRANELFFVVENKNIDKL